MRHRAQGCPGGGVCPRALHRVQRHRSRHPLPGASRGVRGGHLRGLCRGRDELPRANVNLFVCFCVDRGEDSN